MKTTVLVLFAFLLPFTFSACVPTADNTPVSTSTPVPTEDAPPPATLEINGSVQNAGIGTNCWSIQTNPNGPVEACIDTIGIPTALTPIVSESPFTAQLHFLTNRQPQQVAASVSAVSSEHELHDGTKEYRWWSYVEGTNLELTPATEQEIKLDLESGLYLLNVFSVWENKGEVTYGFLIKVK